MKPLKPARAQEWANKRSVARQGQRSLAILLLAELPFHTITARISLPIINCLQLTRRPETIGCTARLRIVTVINDKQKGKEQYGRQETGRSEY